MSRVDVIIPTRNGAHWLRGCLRALEQSAWRDFSIIVVDDASDDADAEAAAASSTSLQPTVLRLERNVGFAGAMNAALVRSSAPYVALLNNDTEVAPGWLAALVACAAMHPDAGSIASRMRLLSEPNRFHSAGDTFSATGMPDSRGVWLEDVGQYDQDEPVFAACAGAALYRREALQAVALPNGHVFDERLRMYCEDVDLAWRLQAAGWHCWYAADAQVLHALSATGGGVTASYLVSRNLPLVLRRSVPPGVLASRRRIAARYLGRTVRELPHLREAAARASIRGALVGWGRAALDRSPRPNIAPHERERIRALLVDRRTAATL